MKQHNNVTTKIPPDHIVQSKEWGAAKTALGTPALRTKSGVQFTLHKIPVLNKYIGYCPKVNPKNIVWEEIRDLGTKNNCIAINFDVPNSMANTQKETFERYCTRSPKDTFARNTIILDIQKSESDLLKNMHPKTRYNIRLAQKKGVTVKLGGNNDINKFLKLQRETAQRQKFYIHSDTYYKTVFSILHKNKMAYLVNAYLKKEMLVSWMVFVYKDVIYYVYGGSSSQHKNLMPSNLTAWETIRLGKRLECRYFDMWGAANDPNNEEDPWYGFTQFKLGFGGKIVECEASWDLILSPIYYRLFNAANKVRWLILKLLK